MLIEFEGESATLNFDVLGSGYSSPGSFVNGQGNFGRKFGAVFFCSGDRIFHRFLSSCISLSNHGFCDFDHGLCLFCVRLSPRAE